MDFNKLIARVKAILMTPKTEWPVIAAEPATVADLYKNYIVVLAALPAIFGFIKGSFIGWGMLGIHYYTPIGVGITAMIASYALSLVVIYVIALIVDALAPSFGGQKNQVQALKAVAYAWTASWVASIATLLPFLGVLIMIAAAVYSIYLLYLGLPATMRCPQDKSAGYTAVTIVIAIVLSWIVAIIIGVMIGGAMMAGGAAAGLGAIGGMQDQDVVVDKDSALGKLDAWSKKVEAASKDMEAAQKSGNADAQSAAFGKMMGAAMGSGQVEALAPDMLKPFVPESIAGLKRTDFSAEKNGAMGMQIAEARATYSDGANRTLRLEVTDTGSAKGLMGFASWASVQNESQTDHGYEKTYKQGDRIVHEQWDAASKSGEYALVVGDRFAVKLSGTADDIGQLKGAVDGMNLAGLEALKDVGVKKG